ncbi:hypothetical protein WICPIJ_007543 [Wickerhamomyces pijperi]|uniref:Uncharacterized protein n=1 Tax=Wickerhamomyces pijperi TaxID=599730 RepID=A0A9P8Q2A2_WICPI|nr:hypothetical protein WICPIJ_007543 [Wickerhamomyces pijperi]
MALRPEEIPVFKTPVSSLRLLMDLMTTLKGLNISSVAVPGTEPDRDLELLGFVVVDTYDWRISSLLSEL